VLEQSCLVVSRTVFVLLIYLLGRETDNTCIQISQATVTVSKRERQPKCHSTYQLDQYTAL